MRLIDADALKDYIKIFDIGCGCSEDYQKSFLNAIDEQPTIEPERTGKWIYDNTLKYFFCSECGEPSLTDDDRYIYSMDFPNFCPNCGAYMMEGEQDE